ncbi:AraC family transcriptional regulator [Paenibacillus nasutitermitis]|uniref:AraC family transcriptional regulator n=1 Tax=Paenibacillus nasutitermitis TaxID=1652958 RepID=UPI001E35661C|nr:helix-turn-helix domain-containing protein [Paenibacillus nasutitermitis]
MASITTLILMLSSLLYYNYTSSSVETVKGLNENILSKISYSSVYMDNLSEKFCQSLLLNNGIMAFAYSTTEDILNISNAIKTLNDLTIPNSYIQSTYIYNPQIDTIIAKETFYNSADFYDKEIVRLLKSPRTNQSAPLYPIPRKIPTLQGGETAFANVYTYILFDTFYNTGSFNSAIVLNVDADWLRLTISSLNNNMSNEGNEIFVIDEKGTIISHSLSDMFMQNIADQPYIRNILSDAAPSGTFFDQLDKKKYVISYVSSDVLKWKFLSLTPYDSVFSSVKKNGYITIIFCLIILLMGLLFSFLASKRLYSPLGALTRGIKQKLALEDKLEKKMDEVGFLSSTFTGIIDKTSLLENRNRDNSLLLKNNFLKNLVTGHGFLSTDKIIAKEKEFNFHVKFTNTLFLFILKIDSFKDFSNTYNENDRSLYKYAIVNIAKEITSQHYRNEVIDTAMDHITVLADIDGYSGKEDELYDLFKAIITNIQNQVMQYLNISLSGTLGFPVDSPPNIKPKYEETLLLSMYRIKLGHLSIITPDILKQVDDGSFMFPASKEKQLIDCLKLGSGGAAKEAYKEIIKTMEHSSYDNIITSVISLFFSIYNSLSRITEGSQSTFNNISIDFFNKVGRFETFQEIEQTFFELFDEIILLKEGLKDRKKNEIVNKVIDMINESFADKNLTLNNCADVFNISSVYLGKMFKTTTGKSVAEYITMVRMEHIKNYLEQSPLPINEILEKCGMEMSNYFYTSFKKYFGVSLTEYRLTHSRKNNRVNH